MYSFTLVMQSIVELKTLSQNKSSRVVVSFNWTTSRSNSWFNFLLLPADDRSGRTPLSSEETNRSISNMQKQMEWTKKNLELLKQEVCLRVCVLIRFYDCVYVCLCVYVLVRVLVCLYSTIRNGSLHTMSCSRGVFHDSPDTSCSKCWMIMGLIGSTCQSNANI